MTFNQHLFSTISTKEKDDKKPTSITQQSVLPGILAASGVATFGFLTADVLSKGLLAMQGLEGSTASVVSGIPIAILAGLAANNLTTLPSSLSPGFKTCSTTILRAGIICVGFKLSFFEMASLGAYGVPCVAASVGTGLLVTTTIARALGIPKKMGALIAAGTSICGVTAITALSPAIKASPRDTAVAVANVVAFGTFGMLTYPYVAHAVFPLSEQVGLALGLGIHDTSQVMGSAMTYKEVFNDEVALKAAAVTKLTRNLFLAGVVPSLAYMYGDHSSSSSKQNVEEVVSLKDKTIQGLATFKQHVPLFVVGFLGASIVRTVGDASLLTSEGTLAFGCVPAETYKSSLSFVGSTASKGLLGTAMAAVGLSTSASALRGIGWKPFAVGLAGATTVGLTGATCAFLVF